MRFLPGCAAALLLLAALAMSGCDSGANGPVSGQTPTAVVSLAATPTLLAATSTPAYTPTPAFSPTAAYSPTPAFTETALPAATSPAETTTTPTSLAEASVTLPPLPAGAETADKIDLGPETNAAYLSPDGQSIATTSRSKVNGQYPICIYTATGQKKQCAGIPRPIDPQSLRWSPDSSHLVFTEDFFRAFWDPDIWVLDAATGKAADLTDDQIDKVSISDMSKSNIDVVPAWSGDSKQIAFIRLLPGQAGGAIGTVLYILPVGGGTPRKAFQLTAEGPQINTLAWSPDSKVVMYSWGSSAKDAQTGLWVSNIDGEFQGPLVQVTDVADISLDLAFSPDGRYVLALNPTNIGLGKWDKSSTKLVKVGDGQVTEIDAAHKAQWAGWAPSGSAIAYIVRDPKNADNSGLYVVPQAGGTSTQVYRGDLSSPASGSMGRLLTWASNNTVLVALPGVNNYLLLHLGSTVH